MEVRLINRPGRFPGYRTTIDTSHASAGTICRCSGKVAGIQPPEAREGEQIILASLADPEGNEIMLTQYVGEH